VCNPVDFNGEGHGLLSLTNGYAIRRGSSGDFDLKHRLDDVQVEEAISAPVELSTGKRATGALRVFLG
jgi:hypothetical protein